MYTSYIQNTSAVNELPIKQKEFHEFTDTVQENFFGEQTMVTKLVNSKSGT